MKLRLKAKTHKAKNRIREHGDMWRIIKRGRPTARPDFPESFFVESLEIDLRHRDHRWINVINDPNFEILEVINENGNESSIED